MIEGVSSYEEIYNETMSKEDMAHLDALGIEWRGRNIYDIQDDLQLKIVELAHRALENPAENLSDLAKRKDALVDLFQVVFEREDEHSSLLHRYDPISGTYQELMGVAKVFNSNFPRSLFNSPER